MARRWAVTQTIPYSLPYRAYAPRADQRRSATARRTRFGPLRRTPRANTRTGRRERRGNSTLARAILRLIPVTGGRVPFYGHAVFALSPAPTRNPCRPLLANHPARSIRPRVVLFIRAVRWPNRYVAWNHQAWKRGRAGPVRIMRCAISRRAQTTRKTCRPHKNRVETPSRLQPLTRALRAQRHSPTATRAVRRP